MPAVYHRQSPNTSGGRTWCKGHRRRCTAHIALAALLAASPPAEVPMVGMPGISRKKACRSAYHAPGVGRSPLARHGRHWLWPLASPKSLLFGYCLGHSIDCTLAAFLVIYVSTLSIDICVLDGWNCCWAGVSTGGAQRSVLLSRRGTMKCLDGSMVEVCTL